jgi:hypothetical protein
MYYQLQIVVGNAAQIGFVDKALHHQDVLAGTGTPQLFGFVHRGDAEQISVVQRFSARHQPMAIGISLDDGGELALWRMATRYGQIMRQRLAVDGGDGAM